jgi:hypothetical protein
MFNQKEKDYLKFQIRRKVINLYKNFFFILEDMAKDSNNKISDTKYQQIRKRILDHGNDTIREIEEDLNKFNITL